VLNLTIVMQRFHLCLLLLFTASLMSLPSFRATAQSASPTPAGIEFGIYTPISGKAVQGSVPIVGHTAIEGFSSSEISFTYQESPRESWFLIHQSLEPVDDETIFIWDTSKISDGDYIIKLTINFEDDSQQDFTVQNIRVRNYTPIETNTPLPPTITPTPPPVITPSATSSPIPSATALPPTATPIPPNPAEISDANVLFSIGKGMLATSAAFILLGIYQRLRKISRKGFRDDF
jgi:hypothetical protein